MKRRTLGRTGLEVSLVGLGGSAFGARLDREATRRVVHRALDLGVTFFDTADVYGKGTSEEFLGDALGARRKDVVLATKFGISMLPGEAKYDASREYILGAVENSLRRLNTDFIDLYQLHWPDPSTPIEETLRALDDLVAQGKIRFFGCSNMPACQIVRAHCTSHDLGLREFVTAQDEYNLLARGVERELVPAMTEYQLALLPYFPLAGGLLSGEFEGGGSTLEGRRLSMKLLADRYLNDGTFEVVDAYKRFCAERGRTLLELAFSWLGAQPVVASIIAGASKPQQIEMNVNAAAWDLSAHDLQELLRIRQSHGL